MSSVSSTTPSPSPLRLAVPATPRAGEVATAAVVERKSTSTVDAVRAASEQVKSPASAGKLSVPSLPKEVIARQIHEMQAKMDKLNPALAFVMDPDSGKALIQLTDRATKEVILQFPTEAALQINKALDQFQKGQLISRTV